MFAKEMPRPAAAVLAALLAGCASSPEKIATTDVSTMQYQPLDCAQLATEYDRVSRRAVDLYTRLDKEAGNDAAQMTVGLLFFWPALFMLEGGDGPEAAEYARLKGEKDAIESVAAQKQCALPPPPPIPASKPTTVEARQGYSPIAQ